MKLGVNIDHIATLREARQEKIPDLIKAASICEQAGCDSIVCHLRQDRRHIQDNDLINLRKNIKTSLNLEMSSAEEIVMIALKVKPDQATLVPERRQELTTEGGLDVISNQKRIAQVVRQLCQAEIFTSLFIDPEPAQVKAAKQTGARCIELHTGKYANATSLGQQKLYFQEITQSAQLAAKVGLKVFAGHGLNYVNVENIIMVKEIEELNIGFAIIAQAVFSGLENAVKQMLGLING